VQEAEVDGVHERVASFERGGDAPIYVRSLTLRDAVDPARLVYVGGVVASEVGDGPVLTEGVRPVVLRPRDAGDR
jgi:hypothetical protein